jgi:uncharacterized protein YacL
MAVSDVVSRVISSQAAHHAYQAAVLWGGRLVGLLQNRFLAGIAFIVSTFVGCVFGAIIAPLITRRLCEVLDRIFTGESQYLKTHKFCVGSVVFLTFGLVVLAINVVLSKSLQLPLSRRFFFVVTATPPALLAFNTAYYHE